MNHFSAILQSEKLEKCNTKIQAMMQCSRSRHRNHMVVLVLRHDFVIEQLATTKLSQNASSSQLNNRPLSTY